MELSLEARPGPARVLGPALVLILAVVVSCPGGCRHRVPGPGEVLPLCPPFLAPNLS